MVYFSSVSRREWLKGVDSRPPARLEEDAASTSSESGGTDASWTENSPLVSEKVWGKRATADELAWKKRKMAAAGLLKSGGISLGGDQTTRTQRTTVFEWLNDDKILMAAPSSTETPCVIGA